MIPAGHHTLVQLRPAELRVIADFQEAFNKLCNKFEGSSLSPSWRLTDEDSGAVICGDDADNFTEELSFYMKEGN